MAAADEPQPLHILFFPYIATGHLIPVADMAAVFASRGVKCTILTTPANAAVIRPAVDRANAAAVPAIDMVTVPFPDVGLPPGVESVTGISSEADMFKLLDGSNRLREPFERFLEERRPDAVIADSFFPWAADAAAAHGVPRLSFLGTSMFARACTHALLRHNPALADGGDADDVVLPGLPHRVALRRSQLLDPAKPNHRFEWAFYELVDAADARSYGEVFNSFADLEPGCVDHYRAALGRRVWLTGPLAHVRTDDIAGAGGLSPDDERCLRWLDGKPRGSVVYVSFGTLTHFSPAEQRELARGLQISGKNFLWIMGGEDADASEWMPEGFAELFAAGDQRGLIFRAWAPQTRILNHPAVGGFVTHCGWNSVLEAVSAGVPLVTWPRYADQFYNEKLVVEVLKVGVSIGSVEYASKLEVRDHVISGETIAEAIGGVMGDDEVAEQRRVKAKELGAKAKRATEKGGSSYEDVGRLIQELMARRSSVVRA
ncbi:hypothetical protein EJB05_34913, partial [Eragrostis curvula]